MAATARITTPKATPRPISRLLPPELGAEVLVTAVIAVAVETAATVALAA
jgi:hypothetical protein